MRSTSILPRIFLSGTLVVAGLGIFVEDALAQPPASTSSSSVSNQAKDHIRAGLAYAERGKWEDALREFEEAYAIEPQPLRLFDVAQARAKTRRYRAAADAFASLAESDALTPDQRARAKAGLASSREKIAHLTITVENGALATDKLSVDQESAASGTPIEIDPGKHVVKLVRDGKTTELPIELSDGATKRVTISPSSSEAVATKPDPERPIETPSTGAPTPTLTYVFGGLGIAALGTGAALSIVGYSGYSDLEATGCTANKTCRADDVDPVRTQVIAGNVLLGVGVVAAVAATWIFLSSRSDKPSASGLILTRDGLRF